MPTTLTLPTTSGSAAAASPAAPGATLLRVALGSMWIAHALFEALVFTLPGGDGAFALRRGRWLVPGGAQ